MSDRTKLNVAYFNGALLISAATGWLSGSWAVFLMTTAAALACVVYDGEIRRALPPDEPETVPSGLGCAVNPEVQPNRERRSLFRSV